MTGELLTNTVEVTSGIGDTVAAAVDDIADAIAAVRTVTNPMDVELLCAGSHPFAQWYDQGITDKTRYHKLIERTQWWGRNMMIWGIHVHVGVEDVNKVFPIINALAAYLPHLQALSASSPFWAGERTGYASNRALVFQQLPTAGLPWPLAELDASSRATSTTWSAPASWRTPPRCGGTSARLRAGARSRCARATGCRRCPSSPPSPLSCSRSSSRSRAISTRAASS